jgi:hypothetical protein
MAHVLYLQIAFCGFLPIYRSYYLWLSILKGDNSLADKLGMDFGCSDKADCREGQ